MPRKGAVISVPQLSPGRRQLAAHRRLNGYNDFERAAEEARRVNRYEFLFMAAPLRVEKGMGSPLNPLAIF
jgi:kynurenine formamidase